VKFTEISNSEDYL